MNEQWTPEQLAAIKALNEPLPAERKLVFIKGKFVGEIDMPAQRKPLYQLSGTIHYGGPAGGSMKD